MKEERNLVRQLHLIVMIYAGIMLVPVLTFHRFFPFTLLLVIACYWFNRPAKLSVGAIIIAVVAFLRLLTADFWLQVVLWILTWIHFFVGFVLLCIEYAEQRRRVTSQPADEQPTVVNPVSPIVPQVAPQVAAVPSSVNQPVTADELFLEVEQPSMPPQLAIYAKYDTPLRSLQRTPDSTFQ